MLLGAGSEPRSGLFKEKLSVLCVEGALLEVDSVLRAQPRGATPLSPPRGLLLPESWIDSNDPPSVSYLPANTRTEGPR